MDEKMIKRILEMVLEAGKPLKETHTYAIQSKTNFQDLVTEMDKNTEKYLREQLIKFTPDCTFIGEEGNQEMSDSVWIIDPIDGTTNFINTHRDFGVSLAYYQNKKPVLGIVYDVQDEKLYWAASGKGAYINDKKVEPDQPKHTLSECLWDASLPTLLKNQKLFDLYKQTRGYRSLGACTLATIRVALGQVDFHISMQAKCWDYAAVDIFLKECNKQSWCQNDFFTCKPNTYIAANDPEILEQIKTYF